MKLAPLLDPEIDWVVEKATSGREVLRELASRVVRGEQGDPGAAALDLTDAVAGSSVSVEDQVAFVHVRGAPLGRSRVAVALVRGGVRFGAGQECRLVFLLAGPPEAAWEHLRLLARIARICRRPGALTELLGAGDAADLHRRLTAEDDRYG